MYDVFFSHSSKDKDKVDKVVEYLEDKGLKCWIAPRDIVPGSDWAAAISEAIRSCPVFLVVYSENSSVSEQCMRELAIAETRKNVTIVPYKIDDAELKGSYEYYLVGAHWITVDEKKKDPKYHELFNVISSTSKRLTEERPADAEENVRTAHVTVPGDQDAPAADSILPTRVADGGVVEVTDAPDDTVKVLNTPPAQAPQKPAPLPAIQLAAVIVWSLALITASLLMDLWGIPTIVCGIASLFLTILGKNGIVKYTGIAACVLGVILTAIFMITGLTGGKDLLGMLLCLLVPVCAAGLMTVSLRAAASAVKKA